MKIVKKPKGKVVLETKFLLDDEEEIVALLEYVSRHASYPEFTNQRLRDLFEAQLKKVGIPG